jgi:hypothetical protein
VIFKERAFICTGCGARVRDLMWDHDTPASCCGEWADDSHTLTRNTGVIDDQLEGGPRWFENLGHAPVWIESKSQWRREVEKRNVVNVVRHDSAYYAKQRKMHDEKLRDERSV